MPRILLTLLATTFLLGGCVAPIAAQPSVSERVDALEAELEALRHEAAAVEAEITGLRAVAAGAGKRSPK